MSLIEYEDKFIKIKGLKFHYIEWFNNKLKSDEYKEEKIICFHGKFLKKIKDKEVFKPVTHGTKHHKYFQIRGIK
jgi:hypothetical protein